MKLKTAVKEEIIEVVEHIPQDDVQSRTVEQLVDVPVLWIQEETGQVIQPTVQKRISRCVVEQIVDVLVPETGDHSVEVVKADISVFPGRLALWQRGKRQPHRSQQEAAQREEEQKETGMVRGRRKRRMRRMRRMRVWKRKRKTGRLIRS